MVDTNVYERYHTNKVWNLSKYLKIFFWFVYLEKTIFGYNFINSIKDILEQIKTLNQIVYLEWISFILAGYHKSLDCI